ncbi:hypothetical protein AB8A31_26700 [Tardiphaga sp. 804_B3_N1_9]|uniref:hypothetical protein n=1 Tax=Tardiphaga TaxID=1395974 RepID=UPI0015862BB4|nr:hypothetical protein [Tardiphaga robiniae]NUU41556.1 hypothetical protein [Tardiphaga robiniae]
MAGQPIFDELAPHTQAASEAIHSAGATWIESIGISQLRAGYAGCRLIRRIVADHLIPE